MEVTELTAETFWKGETEIRGTVMDGEDEYRVRILRKGSQNFDYSCSVSYTHLTLPTSCKV